MAVSPRRLAAAERAWKTEMYSTKLSLKHQVKRRYDKSGVAGLQRRARTLAAKRNAGARELAELYVLNDAISHFGK